MDLAAVEQLRQEYNAKWESAQAELDAIVGFPVNVESAVQMRKAFHDVLGLPFRYSRVVRGKTTLDENALVSLAGHCASHIFRLKTPEAIAPWEEKKKACLLGIKNRKIRTLIERYIDVEWDDDGRAHWVIVVGGTETGRSASKMTPWGTGLNGQTIPRSLRHMFIPDEGKVFIEFDLKAGETWVYAHLAAEERMLEILYGNKDFHVETALAIFNLSLSEYQALLPDKKYKVRFLAKKCNHALSYMMGEKTLADEINAEAESTGVTVSQAEAKRYKSAWLKAYPGMPIWWEKLKQQYLEQGGRLFTPYGRVRVFYQHQGSELDRELAAHIPQSTSHDYLVRGMLEVWETCSDVELLHENHDSILTQVDEANVEAAIPAVIACIERSIEINGYQVTIPVEAQVGRSWGELTTYGG